MLNKTLTIGTLAILLLALAPSASAAEPVDDAVNSFHCLLPTTWECIKAYGDWIFVGHGVCDFVMNVVAGHDCVL